MSSAMIIGINSQNLQTTLAQTYPPGTTNTASGASATDTTAVKAVYPNHSPNKEFWINTVHLDGMTNLHAAIKCDTCTQNIHCIQQSNLL